MPRHYLVASTLLLLLKSVAAISDSAAPNQGVAKPRNNDRLRLAFMSGWTAGMGTRCQANGKRGKDTRPGGNALASQGVSKHPQNTKGEKKMNGRKLRISTRCASNAPLSNITSKSEMERAGWSFDFNRHKVRSLAGRCGGGANWYGYSEGDAVGTLSAVLRGDGIGTLVFGNCYNAGKAKVYLNNTLIDAAPPNTRERIITFNFTDGTTLKVKDEEGNAVVEINSFAVTCGATVVTTTAEPGKYCKKNWARDFKARTIKPLHECQSSCRESPSCKGVTVGTYSGTSNICVLCTSSETFGTGTSASWATTYWKKGAVNLALKYYRTSVKSSQSSTYQTYVKSSNALDGVQASKCTTCNHYASTNIQDDPSWTVFLNAAYPVSRVVVVNRGECCGGALDGLKVKVGDQLCRSVPTVPEGLAGDFNCHGLVGASIKIELPGKKRMLTLVEVEVYEVPEVVFKATESSCYDGVRYFQMKACASGKCVGPGPSQCTACAANHAFLAWRANATQGSCHDYGACTWSANSRKVNCATMESVGMPGLGVKDYFRWPSHSTKWGKMQSHRDVSFPAAKKSGAAVVLGRPVCRLHKIVWCQPTPNETAIKRCEVRKAASLVEVNHLAVYGYSWFTSKCRADGKLRADKLFCDRIPADKFASWVSLEDVNQACSVMVGLL